METKDIFDQQFSLETLQAIFEEKISISGSVGKDGIHPSAFKKTLASELDLIHRNANARNYKFTTYKQRLILKGAGQAPREISIAGVRDRVTLKALNQTLSQIFTDARPAMAHQYIAEIKQYISPLGDDYKFVQLDVQKFFPSIVHSVLMDKITARTDEPRIIHLLLQAISTGTGVEIRNKVGVPQGLSIANILSSIYMIEADKQFQDVHNYQYYRYVDDILIICKADTAEATLAHVTNELAAIGLTCHPPTPGSKTKIASLSDGVDYLGYRLSPGNVSIRRSSYQMMMERIMSLMTEAKHNGASRKQVRRLNLKISGCFANGQRYGWMFYFSMTDDIPQLRRLDRFLKKAWLAVGLDRFGTPKTFVKTYHEIKFNLAATKYIPRFDDYTVEQMMSLIADLGGGDLDYVRNWTEEKIRRTFWSLVKREIRDLEKDMTPAS